MAEKFYPKAENLGEDCSYWCLDGLASGCGFPRYELSGRRSCEGIVDSVCLLVKDGREPHYMSAEQIQEIRTKVAEPASLPPGRIY